MRTKYNASVTEVDGIRFASKREAARYIALKEMEVRGEITALERQVRLPIRVNDQHICYYIADFRYQRNGDAVVEDAKGCKTDVYRLKRKLVRAALGIEIIEV